MEESGDNESSLMLIKEWVATQSFPDEVLTDLHLLNFLRGCKFDQLKTRDKLTHYLQLRSSKSEFFHDRDPCGESLREAISRGIMISSTIENFEIVIVRWKYCDIKKVSLINASKLGFMLFDVFMNESPTCMINGHTVIIDCENLPLGYALQLSPRFIRELKHVVFKAYPTRIKAIHVVNCFPGVGTMFNIFKPILPVKIVSRIHFYKASSISELRAHIPPSVLPKDYGGEGETLDTLRDVTRSMFEERRSWFLKELSDARRQRKSPPQQFEWGTVYAH
ncbi:retinol-binding protein pinta-like isoform X1 [Photinus pyralis]|uniref:retinol-binding protein pinta-like isoform X1 n=2 Tax=Photinus pyralis TaxID=7054 RepID=UPI0012674CDB|nr:retinol-binding protein pinta-like isoform X1 [Photinus pyralis]